MKKNYAIVAALLCTFGAMAQTRLHGTLKRADDNAPLTGATIIANNKEYTTSGDGSFTLPCSDSVTIDVILAGFEPLRTKVLNCATPLDLALQRTATNLEEVEITSVHDADKDVVTKPVSIVKLSHRELKRATGLFLDDAINQNIPGVFMERRSISGGQQFNIRGYGNGTRGTNGVNSNFDSQGSKTYLNGIPLTDAEGITLLDDIDFSSLGNVDVIKGPAGTMYGLAIAGVVDLHTAKAERNKISVGEDVLAGSYGLQRYTSHLRIGTANASILLNYGKQKYDGFMPHTASHKDFVNLFTETTVNSRQSVSAYFGYSNSYDERSGELTLGQWDTLNYTGNPAYIKNDAHSAVISIRAGVSHAYSFSRAWSNTTTLFGSSMSTNAASAAGWTDKNPLNYGLRSVFSARYLISDKVRLTGQTGLEIQRQDAQTIGYSMVTDSSNRSGYNIIGAMRSNQATVSRVGHYFTEWVLHLPADISVTAGIGLSEMQLELNDRFYVAAGNKPSGHLPSQFRAGYYNMWSPHFALQKMISGKASVYASYSKGYKAPVSSYFYVPSTGQVNRGLVPEAGEQVEVGTKGNFLKEKFHYQLAAFDAVFYNKMTAVAVPVNSVTTGYSYVRNGGTQHNRGLEALIKYTFVNRSSGVLRQLAPFFNAAYSAFRYGNFRFQVLNSARTAVIETDYSGKVVAGVPPLVANAGIDFGFAYGFYGNAVLSYRDAMYFTSDNLNSTKAISVLNAKIGWRNVLARHWTADIFAGANNITGSQQYYMVFLNQLPDAYLPGPRGINFFGGVNVRYIF